MVAGLAVHSDFAGELEDSFQVISESSFVHAGTRSESF